MPTDWSETCKDCIKCDPNSITAFPLVLDVAASETLYNSVEEPVTMNFQWAARSTSPQFIKGGATIDEVGGGATNITTLKFNNKNYTIYSVQIAAATHMKWVIPGNVQAQNIEDMIIIFYNPLSTLSYNYIMIVLPIIRNGTAAKDPLYLQGLNSDSMQGTFSLSSCLPGKNALFTYYATCIDGYTAHKTPEKVYVFTAVNGISVSSSLMESLVKKVSASGTSFPSVTLPFISHFNNIKTTVGNSDFTNYVLSTRTLLDYAGVTNYVDLSIDARTDPSSAYKCVSLDPDKDVKDGKLQVDLTTGKLLSDVLAEREAMRAASAPVTQNSAKTKYVEKIIGYVLAGICGVVIFVLIGYYLYSYSLTKKPAPVAAPSAAAGSAAIAAAVAAAAPSRIQTITTYGIAALVAGTVGLTIGLYVS